eukprot:5355592-Pleurochrysis_carterae.AAC.1
MAGVRPRSAHPRGRDGRRTGNAAHAGPDGGAADSLHAGGETFGMWAVAEAVSEATGTPPRAVIAVGDCDPAAAA